MDCVESQMLVQWADARVEAEFEKIQQMDAHQVFLLIAWMREEVAALHEEVATLREWVTTLEGRPRPAQ
jgi:hypothetical protein